ncbi:hypothetical protein POM88_051748 [Heracleum sosnowskyi]|uniref:Aminotransferase-like plant mobile domain-containing protein n=1 Tax=Heracleum sosnowskyi TaxID=360622 RepID=A0AAD8H034_9APIA|nr:hypothetical protein POM88_051748 [Heracleum sosnowskyi]
MADHVSDNLVEERQEVMYPPSSGNPTLRNAHFLKPVFQEHHKNVAPSPSSLSSKPTFQEKRKYKLRSYKGHPSEKWKIWVEKLRPKYQEIWKKAGIFEAIMASTYAISKDKNLIFGLAERWCGESFFTPLADDLVDILNCLKKVHLKAGRGHRGGVNASAWMKCNMCRGNRLEHEAFLAMWLSKFVFVSSNDHIAVKDFCVAIHLSRGTRIALAPVILASIYREMRLLHNSIVESVKQESVVGLTFSLNHYDLVQMWAWERFPELRPTPSVVEKGEPRSARWNGATILNVEDMREVLDSGKESFVWRPYSLTRSNSVLSKLYKDNEQWLVVESDDQESFARCLRVSELAGLGYTEQYSPNRVAMQFGLDQDVPAYVIRSNQSPEAAWSSYNRSIRGMKLYIPPRQFESDISSRYVVWWKGLLVINEEVVSNSIQNEKQLPLTSCRQKKDANFLTSTGWLFGSALERRENSLAIDQLMSFRRKKKSSGRSNDHESVLNTFSRIETPAKVICMTEPVEHVMAVNQELVTDCIQNEKQLLLVSYRQKEDANFLTSIGCAAERPEDSIAIDQLMSCSTMTKISGRRNEHEPVLHTFSRTEIPTNVICMTEPVRHIMVVNEETVAGGIQNEKHSPLVSCGHKRDAKSLTTPGCLSGCAEERLEDDEEDGLTIAQLLSRSRKTESSMKRNDIHDEPLSNIYSKIETPTKLICKTGPVESSVRSLSSSGKCKNSESPAENKKESGAQKGAVVSEANHAEVNTNNIKHNIVKIEEESYDNTPSASELPQLGLKARILRLETIINMIKAEKNVSGSTEI